MAHKGVNAEAQSKPQSQPDVNTQLQKNTQAPLQAQAHAQFQTQAQVQVQAQLQFKAQVHSQLQAQAQVQAQVQVQVLTQLQALAQAEVHVQQAVSVKKEIYASDTDQQSTSSKELRHHSGGSATSSAASPSPPSLDDPVGMDGSTSDSSSNTALCLPRTNNDTDPQQATLNVALQHLQTQHKLLLATCTPREQQHQQHFSNPSASLGSNSVDSRDVVAVEMSFADSQSRGLWHWPRAGSLARRPAIER